MIRWKVYYADGSTFSNEDGGPGDAPSTGVLSIRQRLDCDHHKDQWLKAEGRHNSDGRVVLVLLENSNWYFWADGHWFRTDLLGFLDQAMHCGARYLKQGRYVTHEAWERAMMQVQSDPDFA